MRMVRARSAIERVIACGSQVAWVENLAAAIPELSTAFINRYCRKDQVEGTGSAVGVFLGDQITRPQIGLDHFLLAMARLALSAPVHDLGIRRSRARQRRQRLDLVAQF
jgi:hypothetical protein